MKQEVMFRQVKEYQGTQLPQVIEEMFAWSPQCSRLQAGMRVLLKPNLLSKSHPDKAITTHPQVVRGVIQACVARGVAREDILLADSAGGLYNPKQCRSLYQTCGMSQVAQEEGISLYTACESQEYPVDGKVVQGFTLIKPAKEVDFIINLPKFKTHVMTGMTAACKNMFGCIPGLDKSQWHTRFPDKVPFGEMLLDLYQLLPPDFSILDGILAMEGDGPGGGKPRDLGILMASESPLSMDLAVAEMMGYEGKRIPYLLAGMERGYCSESFDPALAVGETQLFAPIPHWQLPASYQEGGSSDTTFSQFLPALLRPLGRAVEEYVAPKPVISKKDCIGCEKCLEICSKNAITFENKQGTIVKKDCIRCFCCHEVCPVNAIHIQKASWFGGKGKS